MSVSYTLRMPDDLRRLIAQAAKSGGVSDAQLVVDACWKYLERDSSGVEQPPYKRQVDGSSPSPATKSDMQALREICAGNNLRGGLGSTGAAMDNVPRDRDYIEEGFTAPPPQPPCIVCEEPMREVKGKWACQDVSCGKYGVEQRPR